MAVMIVILPLRGGGRKRNGGVWRLDRSHLGPGVSPGPECFALGSAPHSASLRKRRLRPQSVASFRVQACGYVDSRKALRVGEYSDLCRMG